MLTVSQYKESPDQISFPKKKFSLSSLSTISDYYSVAEGFSLFAPVAKGLENSSNFSICNVSLDRSTDVDVQSSLISLV